MKKNYKHLSLKKVDGFRIRNFLDLDFGAIHRHSPNSTDFSGKNYIPKGEIWIDRFFWKERDFLLKTEFCDQDKEFLKRSAVFKGNHRDLLKDFFCQKSPIPNFKKSKEKIRGIQVYYVDGETVRKYLDPGFVFGGHGYVYPYIPKNEVWLDNSMSKKEASFVLEHEFFERNLMKKGMSYDNAHEFANAHEKDLRRKKLGASYPGFDGYPWRGLNNKKIANKIYVK